MDAIDLAQQHDELFRQSALRRHFAGTQPDPVGVPRDRRCLDCGEKIETARLKALPHAVRCFDCQNKNEREDKHGFV